MEIFFPEDIEPLIFVISVRAYFRLKRIIYRGTNERVAFIKDGVMT